MRNLSRTLFLAIIINGFLVSSVHAENLVDAYNKAVASDPLLKEAAANRMATLESKPQARANLLPTINLNGTYDDRGTVGTFSNFSPSLGTSIPVTTDSDSRTLNYQLRLAQPLFRWDSWIALKRADKTIAQAEANFAAAEQDLAFRVALRYFAVLSALDSLQAGTLNKEAIGRQLEQNETRFEVGLIAITDVLESRAAYDQSVAAEIEAQRILASAHENLREVTGSYLQEIASPGETFTLVAPSPADGNAWVERAMAQNLTLEATRLAVEIANDDVRTMRTGHYPTLDLVLSRNETDAKGDAVTQGVFIPDNNKQDSSTNTISLQFNVPIYNGGGVKSRVRQAAFQKEAAVQRLERVARETERQTRDAYLRVLSDISRVSALKEAVKSSETALSATETGFDVGTRTSVDVLNSRRDLLRAQVDFYSARYDYITNLVLLKQASGSLSPQDLVEINTWLTNSVKL